MREPGGLPAVKYQGNAHVPLVAMDNIDAFTKAAVEYGIPESFAFLSNDLYEAHKGTFYKVIRCLDQLGVEVCHSQASLYVSFRTIFFLFCPILLSMVELLSRLANRQEAQLSPRGRAMLHVCQ